MIKDLFQRFKSKLKKGVSANENLIAYVDNPTLPKYRSSTFCAYSRKYPEGKDFLGMYVGGDEFLIEKGIFFHSGDEVVCRGDAKITEPLLKSWISYENNQGMTSYNIDEL